MSLSKGQKTALQVLAWTVFVIVIAAGLVWFFTSLWTASEQKATKKCENIARIAGNKEYLVGDDWTCYILNGNKIEKVN